MMSGRVIPADFAKEDSALLPLWLGSAATVWVGGHDQFLFRFGFVAYLLGSAALGALSIGHEYTNRTLPFLLSTPVSRRRMFSMKAAVLIPMLLSLAWIAIVRRPAAPAGRELKDTVLVGTLSLLSSAFLAPWLTMVCRNIIAGALFSLSIPAALLVGRELLALAVTGHVDSPSSQAFRMQALWGAMVLLSVVGAVSSWRGFMRLETIEGQRSEFRLPGFAGRSTSTAASVGLRRGHPAWSLVRKELRLQQLTFAVSGLYICGWIATLVLGRFMSARDVDDVLVILTVVHGTGAALLSGSLASAEERHLGVVESQVLLPMSMRRQWAIKTGVVLGLCLLLAIVLPAALMWISLGARFVRFNGGLAIVVIVLAGVALYVSSVSNNTVKALVISGPTALSLVVVIRLLGDAVLWVERLTGTRTTDDIFGRSVIAAIVVIVFALLLRFALTNHRSSDRSARAIWGQILWLSGSVVAVLLTSLFAR